MIDLKYLEAALNKYGVEAENGVRDAMRRTAQFGVTAAVRTYTRTRDPFRIRASGTYGASFRAQDTKEGAILYNSAHYAIFVERGRKPGKMPPLDPILEWIYEKKIARRAAPIKQGPKTPPKQGPKTPPKFGPKQQKPRLKHGKRKSKKEMLKFAKKVAWQIRVKISKDGTKGRWVLRRTMPAIAKRSSREIKKELDKVAKRNSA